MAGSAVCCRLIGYWLSPEPRAPSHRLSQPAGDTPSSGSCCAAPIDRSLRRPCGRCGIGRSLISRPRRSSDSCFVAVRQSSRSSGGSDALERIQHSASTDRSLLLGSSSDSAARFARHLAPHRHVRPSASARATRPRSRNLVKPGASSRLHSLLVCRRRGSQIGNFCSWSRSSRSSSALATSTSSRRARWFVIAGVS